MLPAQCGTRDVQGSQIGVVFPGWMLDIAGAPSPFSERNTSGAWPASWIMRIISVTCDPKGLPIKRCYLAKVHLVLFIVMGGTTIAVWFIRQIPMNMDDDWGYPYFRKPPSIVRHIFFLAFGSSLLVDRFSHSHGCSSTEDHHDVFLIISIFGWLLPRNPHWKNSHLCTFESGSCSVMFHDVNDFLRAGCKRQELPLKMLRLVGN